MQAVTAAAPVDRSYLLSKLDEVSRAITGVETWSNNVMSAFNASRNLSSVFAHTTELWSATGAAQVQASIVAEAAGLPSEARMQVYEASDLLTKAHNAAADMQQAIIFGDFNRFQNGFWAVGNGYQGARSAMEAAIRVVRAL